MLSIEELNKAYKNLSELRRITKKAQRDLLENYLKGVKADMEIKFPDLVVNVKQIMDDGFALELNQDYTANEELLDYILEINDIFSNNFQEHLFTIRQIQ